MIDIKKTTKLHVVTVLKLPPAPLKQHFSIPASANPLHFSPVFLYFVPAFLQAVASRWRPSV